MRSGLDLAVRCISGFAAATFYRHLLVSLRDEATYLSHWGTALWEPERSSPDTKQRLDNDATICIVVDIDSAWPLGHAVVFVVEQQEEGLIDIV